MAVTADKREQDFADWFFSRGDSLTRFAFLACAGDRDLAADVVQDVLLHVTPRWDRVRRAQDIDAYMRRCVVNRRNSVLRWRRLRRRPSGHLGESLAETTRLEDVAADRVDLWQACLGLPRAQRDAVVLRYFEDRSYREIARILGTTESTARGYVHRALATLRIEFSNAELEPRDD